MQHACSSSRRGRHWLTPRRLTPLLLMLVPSLVQAHGYVLTGESPWHKLAFWNAEFHLFAMIFWLAIATLVVLSVLKLIQRLSHRHEQPVPPLREDH